MKQYGIKTIFIILFIFSVAGITHAKVKAKHVFLIGPDGWGAYSFEKADMPNVKKLTEEGAYTQKKRSVLPSSSAVNWASMFMGYYEQSPDYKTVPEGLCNMAVKYITEKRPDFTAIIFDKPDHTGHQAGHDTPEYYTTLTCLDGYVGKIIEAVKNAGILDETIFIITSDHGGINKGHGGKTIREMETPFIISGKNIKKGMLFDESMMQFDIASTIAYIFDLKQPQVWIGRPMTQIFK
jgi:predicted AlkP superfamily pyrophosphatase or phosphodiesterase